jgi:hypothetical protein
VKVEGMSQEAPKTISVPAAGRKYYGIGKNLSYDAARRGQIPTIRVGRLLRVPVAAMERLLEKAGENPKDRNGRDG